MIALKISKPMLKKELCNNTTGMSIREDTPLSKKETVAYIFFFSDPSTREPTRKLKRRGMTKEALTTPVINADLVEDTVTQRIATVNTDDPSAEIPSSAKTKEKFFFRYASSPDDFILSLLRISLLN